MKARICLILICSLLLGMMILPIQASDSLQLSLAQADTVEPGQDATLTLSLPTSTIAGGFFKLQYDASLFTLKKIALMQASDALTLTYHDVGGSINILLDAAQNVQIEGALLSLTFACSEEAQPGTYPIICTVPDATSFYALEEDGSTVPLDVIGCQGHLTLSAPPLPDCPARYLACQETNPANGNITVRLCALVDPESSLSRGGYGFICSVTDQNGTREVTLGGSALTDQIEGGGKTYTEEQLGGSIYTSTLTIPADGEVSITLTPYVRLGDMTLYAGTYTVLYTNGNYAGTSLVP